MDKKHINNIPTTDSVHRPSARHISIAGLYSYASTCKTTGRSRIIFLYFEAAED